MLYWRALLPRTQLRNQVEQTNETQRKIRDVVEAHLESIYSMMERKIQPSDFQSIFGRRLSSSSGQSNVQRLLLSTLQADVLRVAFVCLYADGKLPDTEASRMWEFSSEFAGNLSVIRGNLYSDFRSLNHDSIGKFFQTYWKDVGAFGFACASTKWLGLKLCQSVDSRVEDSHVGKRFADCLLTLAVEIIQIDGVPTSEKNPYNTARSAQRLHRIEVLIARSRTDTDGRFRSP